MKTSKKVVNLIACMALVFSMLSLPGLSYASSYYNRGYYYSDEIQRKTDPSGTAMLVDAVGVRPMSAIGLVVGTAGFIVMSPFSLLGGNFMKSGEKLVVDPFKSTFLRCLGCDPDY